MILSVINDDNLEEAFDQIGIGVALKKSKSVLIKINLARPPEPGHPRTDPDLLTKVLQYISDYGACCAIAEGADGFLHKNIAYVGLEKVVKEYNVKVIDLDQEDFNSVVVEDEKHYLPKCLKNYGVRIGIPALSLRPERIFSNNVKLFVGAVPRRMYQVDQPTTWRPRVHIDLHRSVAGIYRAVMKFAPFGFFVNGGKMMIEGQGEMEMPEIIVSDNALELDWHLLK